MKPFPYGGKPIEILLVEDNPGEAEMTKETLAQSRVRNRVHWVENGEERWRSWPAKGRTPMPRAPT
jgi:CheY-like chemotaxis protein